MLSIIIPCYNEEKTLEEVLKKNQALGLGDIEIIVVNDGSMDKTFEIAQNFAKNNPQIKIVSYPKNQGKGFAIKKGLEIAKGEFVIIQDADLEYDPRDIPKVIRPLKLGESQVSYGSRFLKNSWPKRMKFPYWLANKILILSTRILFKTYLTDEATCYKAFRTKLLKNISLKARGFDFCPEVTAKILKRKVKIYEVPISYEARSSREGKKIKLKDFFIALWTLIKYRFKN